LPFLAGSPRLAVRAVKGAFFAFIGAKRRPLIRRSGRSRRRLPKRKGSRGRWVLRQSGETSLGVVALLFLTGWNFAGESSF